VVGVAGGRRSPGRRRHRRWDGATVEGALAERGEQDRAVAVRKRELGKVDRLARLGDVG